MGTSSNGYYLVCVTFIVSVTELPCKVSSSLSPQDSLVMVAKSNVNLLLIFEENQLHGPFLHSSRGCSDAKAWQQ